MTCYTKSGPVADSYMVFAYYEVKLADYEKVVPGLNAWYVCKAATGRLYINDDEQDEKLANYCKIISVQDDVVDLNNTVNVKFNEAVAEDEELAAFLDLLPSLLSSAVGDELAKNSEDAQGDTTDDGVDTPDGEDVQVVETIEKKAKTTDVVNIRSSDSENADKVGKAQKGDEFIVLEQKINGWSKIIYNNKECYIKTEYLQIEGEEQPEEENQQAEVKNDEVTDEEAAANSPSSGKAKARDTVNIRESASTTADRVAVAYKGEEMTVINKQADGWTKVKFNGKTGYVKSEYLE